MAFDPSLLGPGLESYWVEQLDERDRRIDVLDGIVDGASGRAGITAGSVTWNVDAEIQGGASLTIQDPQDIDWMRTRFRPWVLVNQVRWPLGIFLPTSPDAQHTSGGVTSTVTLLDKTSILSGTKTPRTYSVAINAAVVAQVQGVLVNLFGFDTSTVALTPSQKCLATAQTWPAGTPWLKVVNDLLDTIGYNRLWCDNLGRFRSEAWVDPRTVAPQHEFVEGETAIHAPDFAVSQDLTSVPNRVICTTTGDDTTPGLISVATNTDAASPYSYAARGNRWVDATYEGEEATDQATLDAKARKYLAGLQTPPWYVSMQHLVVPLKGRDVVRFASGGIDRLAWVNEWGVTLTPGSYMTSKLRGVTS